MAKERRQIFFEPMIQIRHSSLLFYSLCTEASNHARHKLDYKTYSGKVTDGSKKRIRRAVDLLLQLSPPRLIHNPVSNRNEMHTLSFITLTIPGKEKRLTANEGHKLLLAPWLLKMKRKAGLRTYIWKAEFQKNGQLHYHITTPEWIHYQTIKDEWNNLMSSAGMLANWFAEHGSKMPNSTDVHKVYKIENIGAYLMKYLSKNDQDKETKGKIWDCSMNLKKNKHYSCSMSFQLLDMASATDIKEFDKCSILFTKNPLYHLPVYVRNAYKEYLKAIVQV